MDIKDRAWFQYIPLITELVQEAVNVSLGNLLTYPFVREAVVTGAVSLKGAHYDFVKGTFELWDLHFAISPSIAI